MAKYKHGDIFSIPLSEKEFAFGRLLLDVEAQALKKKKLKADSTLEFFNDVLLISIYKGTAAAPEDFKPGELLIDSVFVAGHSLLGSGKWQIVGHEPVNPETLDFPEFVRAGGAYRAEFVKGEIGLLFEQEMAITDELHIYPSSFPGFHLSAAYLHTVGRGDEITQEFADKKLIDLYARDLRFSPKRREMHEKAGYNAAKSYYENALEMGFDLKRFYED